MFVQHEALRLRLWDPREDAHLENHHAGVQRGFGLDRTSGVIASAIIGMNRSYLYICGLRVRNE